MDLQQLASFVSVAEHRSFSRAARELGIAQPSLSEQIKKLETSLKRPLFDRLPRGVVLTEAGRVLLGHARRLLADADAAKRDVVEAGHRIAGTLHVGAIPTIAPFLLPCVIGPFTRKFPDVRLLLTEDVTARLLVAVEEGSVDLAIVSSTNLPPTVSLQTIGTEPLLAAVPRSHRLAKQPHVRFTDLRGEPMLVLKEMHCLAQQTAELCATARPSGKTHITVQGEQLSTIAAMVDAGLGLSVVPAMMAQSNKRAGVVYKPFVDEASRPINVATSLLRHRSNAARAFLDLLQSNTASLFERLQQWK